MLASRTVLMSLTFVLTLFAGCAGPGGETLGADASVNFDGSGNGSHSDTADCDDEGSISGSGDVSDGSVTLTVTDKGGDEIFTRSFDGDFSLEKTTLKGDAGTWKIDADRRGDDLAGDPFSGQYSFDLYC